MLTTHPLQIPFTSLQFPLYELLKVKLAHKIDRKVLYAHEAAACGSIAGGVAAALTTPLDVLKTRVMLDTRVSSPYPYPYLLCHPLMLSHRRRRRSYPPWLRDYAQFMYTKGPKLFFLVLYHGRCGYLQVAPFSSACTNGLSTASWAYKICIEQAS